MPLARGPERIAVAGSRGNGTRAHGPAGIGCRPSKTSRRIEISVGEAGATSTGRAPVWTSAHAAAPRMKQADLQFRRITPLLPRAASRVLRPAVAPGGTRRVGILPVGAAGAGHPV